MKRKVIIVGELIGKHIKIINSNHKDIIGLCGIVIDETQNLIILKNDKKILKLIRKTINYSLYENKKNETN